MAKKMVSKKSKKKSSKIKKIKTQIVADDPLFIPKPQTEGAACVDLVANIPEGKILVNHRSVAIIDCGFSMAIPDGWQAKINCRSGMGADGIIITNSPATIDSDYRGRIKVLVANVGRINPFVIEHGERIAQMEPMPVYSFEFTETDKLEVTERGENGFGSTGK